MNSGYEKADSLVSVRPQFSQLSGSERPEGDDALDTSAEGRPLSPDVPADPTRA